LEGQSSSSSFALSPRNAQRTKFRSRTGAAATSVKSNVVFSATAPFVASGLLALIGGNPLAVTGYGLVLVAVSVVALPSCPTGPSRRA
jgi:hypothetical protein